MGQSHLVFPSPQPGNFPFPCTLHGDHRLDLPLGIEGGQPPERSLKSCFCFILTVEKMVCETVGQLQHGRDLQEASAEFFTQQWPLFFPVFQHLTAECSPRVSVTCLMNNARCPVCPHSQIPAAFCAGTQTSNQICCWDLLQGQHRGHGILLGGVPWKGDFLCSLLRLPQQKLSSDHRD